MSKSPAAEQVTAPNGITLDELLAMTSTDDLAAKQREAREHALAAEREVARGQAIAQHKAAEQKLQPKLDSMAADLDAAAARVRAGMDGPIAELLDDSHRYNEVVRATAADLLAAGLTSCYVDQAGDAVDFENGAAREGRSGPCLPRGGARDGGVPGCGAGVREPTR